MPILSGEHATVCSNVVFGSLTLGHQGRALSLDWGPLWRLQIIDSILHLDTWSNVKIDKFKLVCNLHSRVILQESSGVSTQRITKRFQYKANLHSLLPAAASRYSHSDLTP
jgi:hypothetical protein